MPLLEGDSLRARLLAEAHTSPAVYALFYRPSDAVAGWEHTDSWDAAGRIPGVHVMTDDAGAQAHLFGAMVSGQALLYDARWRGTGTSVSRPVWTITSANPSNLPISTR